MEAIRGIERERLERVARMYSSNDLASKALGITARSFSRLCRKHGIEMPYSRKRRHYGTLSSLSGSAVPISTAIRVQQIQSVQFEPSRLELQWGRRLGGAVDGLHRVSFPLQIDLTGWRLDGTGFGCARTGPDWRHHDLTLIIQCGIPQPVLYLWYVLQALGHGMVAVAGGGCRVIGLDPRIEEPCIVTIQA